MIWVAITNMATMSMSSSGECRKISLAHPMTFRAFCCSVVVAMGSAAFRSVGGCWWSWLVTSTGLLRAGRLLDLLQVCVNIINGGGLSRVSMNCHELVPVQVQFFINPHGWTQGLSQDFHNRVSKLGFQELRVSKIHDWKSKNHYTDYVQFNKWSNCMLNSSRNVFVIIMKLNILEIQLGISIYTKQIPTSRVSFYLKPGIFHAPGSPKDTQTPCWLRPCQWTPRAAFDNTVLGF